MKFRPTAIDGVWLVGLEPTQDERGFFARAFCAEEFAARGLNPAVAQCGLSLTRRRGTLRGMHYQASPYAEAKLVRCIRGAVYDVALDLRPTSTTRGRWVAFQLDASGLEALYLPEGIAHGFQALTDDVELYYQLSRAYHEPASGGVRWNDPAFGIRWPIADPLLSARDASFPDFEWRA